MIKDLIVVDQIIFNKELIMERKLDIHLQFELPDNYDIDIITDGLEDKEMWSYILNLITDNNILNLITDNKGEHIDICKNASAKIS